MEKVTNTRIIIRTGLFPRIIFLISFWDHYIIILKTGGMKKRLSNALINGEPLKNLQKKDDHFKINLHFFV